MGKLRYTFKTDTLFKMLFVKHRDLLKHLVAALLDIALESIEQFDVRNPEMPPQIMGDKFCRLDINMIVNSQRIDLEIQIVNQGYYAERVMLYWAREFSTALSAGQNYSLLPRTIIISIIDFRLFDGEEFHSFFQPLEVTRHTLLSDKMGFHFFELRKLPDTVSEKDALLPSLVVSIMRQCVRHSAGPWPQSVHGLQCPAGSAGRWTRSECLWTPPSALPSERIR